ncbi:hypothetical protein A2335_02880 [Candidatus Peregrinibacteria bacterium RIFOXYB2_FULL_32_7]|nr:MAG: hypothetical protein A2335_02880 [Candidatus Peregrinibacteria bacterium RIFOXYB2_FULL_32_7]
MQKTCKKCSQNFEITDDDLKFYEKVSPIFEGKKYLIPAPKLCPECRLQRKLIFRNERTLYKRKCDLSGKEIVSVYNPEIKIKVFDNDTWYSDKWSALDYSMEIDLSKSFFEQFKILYQKVPRISLMNQASENSEYANYAYRNKNCYMIFGSHYNEDSFYGSYNWKTKNCLDCLEVLESELIYEGNYCSECYDSRYIQYCFNSNNCYFCYDLIGCKNCIFSSNLRNKEYYIFNKKSSKEEYLNFFHKINFGSYTETKNNLSKFQELIKNSIHRAYFQKNCENSFGDDMQNSKNLYYSFSTKNAEDCRYIYGSGTNMKDCIDCAYIGYDLCESICECIGNSGNTSCMCLNACWHNHNIYYCEQCFGCNDCFGCIGLKNKKYCILNKQYTKEEYSNFVSKIINSMIQDELWGLFFDPLISLLGYNETIAQDYFPLTKFAVRNADLHSLQRFNWSDYEPEFPHVEKIIPANLLPDSISDIPDDILNWAILPVDMPCQGISTNRPFKIIKPELEFYRKMNLPIPHLHPDERHKKRMGLRNPRKLWKRNCMKCNDEIQTTYSPDRSEIVYCEKCFLKSVY